MTLVVGLTGGIACGKSTVSRGLVRRGATLIDADVIARELVEPGTPGLAAIADAFGPEVIGDDGRLLRKKLGALVFAEQGELARLNGILHPAIEAEIRARIVAAAAAGVAVVVLDAALLVEFGLVSACDAVVVVTAPVAAQIERLVARDRLTPEQARDRIASQATHQERLAHADVHIDNGAGPDELERRIAAAWDVVRAM